MTPRFAAALLVLAGFCGAANETDRPRHNTSFVPDDDDQLRQLVLEATRAAGRGEAEVAAERLHSMIVAGGPGVVSLRRREVFASPRRWAQIQLLAEHEPFGRAILDAWRTAHDRGANHVLRRALSGGDENEVLDLLARFPAATGAPGILLALCDRALQRGDPDAARGYLMRSIEHVERSGEQAWREGAPYLARARHLAALEPRSPKAWPTVGGDATRARNGDPLPPSANLELAWIAPFLVEEPRAFTLTDPLTLRERSPILPFYPVCDARHLYVHTGGSVIAVERETGRIAFIAPGNVETPVEEVNGMIDGSPGMRAVTVDDRVLYFNRLKFRPGSGSLPSERNELVAYDTVRRGVIWRIASGQPLHPRGSTFRRPVFFRGAPAVRGERLYVYGAVRDHVDGTPTRKEEAFLFCLDKRTGKPIWERFLGYGGTDAAPGLPPLSGLPPAVGAGVVVVVTGMGVAAGLDARDGEILWLLRYDRKPSRERERLKDIDEQKVYPGSGWFREPPRIVGDSVYFAPFDSEQAYRCWLRGSRRPLDGTFAIVQWDKHRAHHPRQNALLEYFAGIHNGRVYYVARRDEHHSRANYQTVVSHPVDDEQSRFAFARIPATERDLDTGIGVPADLFGRPMIAGDQLLVPTRETVYRFDLARAPGTGPDVRSREIPPLAPIHAPPLAFPPDEERPAFFGSLLSLDGDLYAVTSDRVLCYRAKR